MNSSSCLCHATALLTCSRLDSFAEVDAVLDDTVLDTFSDIESTPLLPRNRHDAAAGEAQESRRVQWAVNINLFINVVLLAAKIVAVLLSNSVSLVASTVDSAMDLLSTIIIAGTAYWVRRQDWHSHYYFPIGKAKLEPIGIIIFSVFMCVSLSVC
jgi:Co/Zn/Cd efflux system component